MAATQKPLSFSLCDENIKYIIDVVAKQKLTNRRYNRSVYMDDLMTHLRTKAEAKAKPKKKKSTALVSVDVEGLNVEAWDKWIAYRKDAKIKAYTTDLKKIELATLGNYKEQAQIVFNSISNQYSGLFPLKKDNSLAKEDVTEQLDSTSWGDNLDLSDPF